MTVCKWWVLLCGMLVGCATSHVSVSNSKPAAPTQIYWAKQSFYGGTFYDDDRYGLISPVPFENLPYLQTSSGDTIIPPPSDEIIKFGTLIELQKVEYPTEQNKINRPLLTPRDMTWIYLTIALDRGMVKLNRDKTYIMLAPKEVNSQQLVSKWLDNYFTAENNNLYFLNLSPQEQGSILKPPK